MKMLAVLLLFTSVVFAQTADKVSAQVTAADQKFNDCVKSRDVQCAAALQQKEFFLAVAEQDKPVGTVPRDIWLKNLESYVIKEMQAGEKIVRVYGKTATIGYSYHQEADFRGHSISGNFFILDVWTKSRGDWKIAARYSSRFFTTQGTAMK